MTNKLAIIGGSGLYDIEEFKKRELLDLTTPWGKPSDQILKTFYKDKEVYFLPRHGRGHFISPSNINFRANIDALKQLGVTDIVSVSAVGSLKLKTNPSEVDLSKIEENIVRCPDPKMASEMEDLIKKIRKNGDTVGGIITCVIKNVPAGLGEPVFNKLHAELGKAMLSINAVKGFEYGSGFEGTQKKGSEHNDLFNSDGSTKTNYSGGIQGGISNGMDIYFNVAFKPVATIMQSQKTINKKGEAVDMQGKGRHDPCVVPRAVPIVEAMSALVLADFTLLNRTIKK